VRCAAVASLVVALAVAGCGGGDDKDDVRATVQAYLDSFVKGDAARTCSLMTEETRTEFVKGARPLAPTSDCATATIAVRAAAGRKAIDALRDAKISKVTVQGNSASAKLKARSGESVATLTKQGGEWKVSSAPGSQ
jgi:ketosteroid isomerase-like protein